MFNARQRLKSTIDSSTAWFTIIGISVFFVFWTVKTTQKVEAVSVLITSNTVLEEEISR
jgi:hypothetical protein